MAAPGPNRVEKFPRAGVPVPASAARPMGVPSRSALFHLVSLVIIVLAMSPVTRNLDNIKMALYLALGPVILVAVLVESASRRIAVPPVSLLAGWSFYLAVTLISTLLSDYRWAGVAELFFLWASLGFCLGGFSHGLTERGIRVLLIAMTGLLLVVNLFGFVQFDLFGTGTTGITVLQEFLGGEAVQSGDQDSAFQTLLHTFATRASTSLMSTVLNRDFYAAFCLLFVGFPLALGLLARRPGIKAFGFVTVGLSVLSILLCQSKGEYIALGVSVVLFALLMFIAGYRPSPGGGTTGAWLLGSLILIVTVLLVKYPVIGEQLKSLEHSFRARMIIYRGAVEIFQAFPVFGGGPGTFKIYFPAFRSPDYFEWGISNVTNFSHNYFLDALSETGVIGLLALLALLVPVAVRSLRTIFRHADPLRVVTAAAALACAVGFLVSNLTSVSARWPIGAVGFWSVVGFLAGVAQTVPPDAGEAEPGGQESREDGRQGRARTLMLVMLATGAVILPFSLYSSMNYWRSQKIFAEGYLLAEQYRDYAIQAIYGGQQLSGEQERFLVGKLNEAAAALEASTRIDPTLTTAYYHLGSTESLLSGLEPGRKEEHLQAALDAFGRLGRLAPDYAELPYNLGIVHYQYALSIEQALDLLPPSLSELRAQLERELEDHQVKALENFERMGELSNRAEVLLNLGESYVRVERPDRALAVYRRGMDLYPDDGKFAERLLAIGLLIEDEGAVIDAQLVLWRLNPLDLDLVLGSQGALARLIELDRKEEFLQAAAEVERRIPVEARLYAWRARAALRWETPQAVRAEVERYRKLGGRDREILDLIAAGDAA